MVEKMFGNMPIFRDHDELVLEEQERSEIVHIVFNCRETDRLTSNILGNHPDVVYFFTAYIKATGQKDIYMDFYKKNKEILQKSIPSLRIITKELDYTNNIEIIQEISKVIKFERELNPNVSIHINVGTGSKITAIASYTASQLWNCNMHYLHSEKYDPEHEGPAHKGKIITTDLTIFPIIRPKKNLILCIRLLADYFEKSRLCDKNDKFIYYKELVELLYNQGILIIKNKNSDERKFQQAKYMTAMKRYFIPLENKWDFIKVSDNSRNKKVYLSKKGKDIAEMFKYYIGD